MLGARAMSNEATPPEGPPAIIELPGGDSITVPLPAGEVPAYAVLPALRALVDAMMQRVKDASAERGETITCKAGCGACCRQYVPVSDLEARGLMEVIRRMPEERQARVRARFAEAEARLRDAGMWDRMGRGGRIHPSEHFRLVVEYFRLGIPCPFLEDEACSIHPDRPLICREYLVVSSETFCAALDRPNIKRLAAPQTSTRTIPTITTSFRWWSCSTGCAVIPTSRNGAVPRSGSAISAAPCRRALADRSS
jgi:Fe-S-cluster containining protein